MTRKYFQICSLLAVFLCGLFLTEAFAAPLIEKIEFDGSDNNADRIIFKLNSATLPKTFALKGPPRAVFDFPGTALAKGVKTNITAPGKFIKGIRTAEHRGDQAKTRVVLDLLSEDAIDFKQDFNNVNNTLTISVFALGAEPPPPPVAAVPPPPKTDKPAAVPPPPPAARETPPAPPAKPAPAVASIPKPAPETSGARDEATVIQPLSEVGPEQATEGGTVSPVLYSIEFDRDAQRGETISFKLNTFNPPVVFGIEEEAPRIVCFFKDTAAGPDLQNLLDVNGRFIKSIQVGKYSNPDNIRVVLDLMPNQNYDLQQIFFKEDNMFMIIISTNV
ncbi:MAG: AMIN domain-containing protein [Thermodesulfobacteriota bacterium]